MSDVSTPPKRLVDLDPRWVSESDGELYGFAFDCPCADAACPLGGRMLCPTKTTWRTEPVCAASLVKGWSLTGDSFENVTVAPSIHYVGHWHGWLRNGVLESC